MHDHSHAHGHGHGHGGDARQRSRRRLALTLVLLVGYMGAEVVGGLLSGSLALLADAGHMLSDAAALALALFALWIAQRPATPQRTFGYYRMEVLAALVNGAALAAVAVLVLIEAWHRWGAPQPVAGGLMASVAAGGLAVNLAALWILHAGKDEGLNVRGAWLHVVGDTLGSVGAVLGGLAVWAKGWTWADPLVSAVISLLVIYSAWALLRDVVEVLMEGTPRHIDLEQVRSTLAATPGVVGVHDLHVWTISSGMEALSGHVVVPPGHPDRPCEDLLRELRDAVAARFGIEHVTLQIEPEGFDEAHLHP